MRAPPQSSWRPTGWRGPTSTGTDLAAVRAVFCYLRDGETVAPSDLLDREGLVELLRSVPA